MNEMRDRIAKRVTALLIGEVVADAVLDELGWDEAPTEHRCIHWKDHGHFVGEVVDCEQEKYRLIRVGESEWKEKKE